jgi:hypothetical protein
MPTLKRLLLSTKANFWLWQEAQDNGERYFPHEYFRRLFAEKLIINPL